MYKSPQCSPNASILFDRRGRADDGSCADKWNNFSALQRFPTAFAERQNPLRNLYNAR